MQIYFQGDEKLFGHSRLPRAVLIDLCNCLEPALWSLTQRSNPVPPHVQVLSTSGFLSTGTFQRELVYRVGISQPSIRHGCNKSTGHTMHKASTYSWKRSRCQVGIWFYCWSSSHHWCNRLHTRALKHPHQMHFHTSATSDITPSMSNSSPRTTYECGLLLPGRSTELLHLTEQFHGHAPQTWSSWWCLAHWYILFDH